MGDKKDKSERLKYLNNQKNQQERRKDFYIDQINKIKELLGANEKEVAYNNKWIKFHLDSIEGHRKEIGSTFDFEKKKDQEEKLIFHENQIKDHHEKNIGYHKKEIDALKEEIEIFEKGIKRCEEQIKFLSEKITENLD